jgi:hypothetical protein
LAEQLGLAGPLGQAWVERLELAEQLWEVPLAWGKDTSRKMALGQACGEEEHRSSYTVSLYKTRKSAMVILYFVEWF